MLKHLFSTVIFVLNFIFLLASIFQFPKFQQINQISNHKLINNICEHKPQQISNSSHFTLPEINIYEACLDNNSYNKNNFGRGRINCSHFESEITCEQEMYAFHLYNNTLTSNKKIFIQTTGTFEEEIKTVQFAFIASILTNRKLYITHRINTIFQNNISISKAPKNAITFKSKCGLINSPSFLENTDDNIFLNGKFDPQYLLLNPSISATIPNVFRTHSLYLMSLFTFQIKEKRFNKNILFIGMLGSGCNADVSILHEGYEKYIIKRFVKLDQKSAPYLISCDIFVGTFGEFDSYYLSNIRGRGSKFVFKNKIIELGSSQSIGDISGIKLDSPEGIKALKYYITFSGL